MNTRFQKLLVSGITIVMLVAITFSTTATAGPLERIRQKRARRHALRSTCPQRGHLANRGRDQAKEKKVPQAVSLFDGKTLAGWKVTQFGGQGEVWVKEGAMVLDFGASLTGITFAGDLKKLPRMNYEISLEAKRAEGIDFFCGLTFPVGDSCCTFICGGWGGGTVGLSCIAGKDASDNDTTKFYDFQKNRWYKIRVRVTPDAIQAWIDNKQMVNQKTTGKKISIRPEVILSNPLGIAAWETQAKLRNIQIRQLPNK